MEDSPTVVGGPGPVAGHLRSTPKRRFRILFVCTGNRCRSPFAALVTRQLLEQRLDAQAARFDVGSAGVRAEARAGLDWHTRRQLTSYGVSDDVLDAFSARQIDDEIVAEADLVLTMTALHRSIVLDKVPRALVTTFLVRELARVGPGLDLPTLPRDPMERARAIGARGPLARARFPARNPTDDDIEDPIGRLSRTHRRVARTVGEAVDSIVGMIIGESGSIMPTTKLPPTRP